MFPSVESNVSIEVKPIISPESKFNRRFKFNRRIESFQRSEAEHHSRVLLRIVDANAKQLLPIGLRVHRFAGDGDTPAVPIKCLDQRVLSRNIDSVAESWVIPSLILFGVFLEKSEELNWDIFFFFCQNYVTLKWSNSFETIDKKRQ
jgi:hypothetical protein